jgi:hypothetical protein
LLRCPYENPKSSFTYPQDTLNAGIAEVDEEVGVFAVQLESMIRTGAGLVVGTVSDDGRPRADRAWSATVIDPTEPRVRFVMSADDPEVDRNLATSPLVALTGADVATFRSVQIKGRPVVVEDPSPDDLELVHTQRERFLQAIEETDGNPVAELRRMLPHRMLAVEMVVTESYDQTPGPGAGVALDRAAP